MKVSPFLEVIINSDDTRDVHSVYQEAMNSSEFLIDMIKRKKFDVVGHVFEKNFELFKDIVGTPCFVDLPKNIIEAYCRKTCYGIDAILLNSVKWGIRDDVINTVMGVTRNVNSDLALNEILENQKMSSKIIRAFEILSTAMRMNPSSIFSSLMFNYPYWIDIVPREERTNFCKMVSKLFLRIDERDKPDTPSVLKNRELKKIMDNFGKRHISSHLSNFLRDVHADSKEMLDLIEVGIPESDLLPEYQKYLIENKDRIIDETKNLVRNYVIVNEVHEE